MVMGDGVTAVDGVEGELELTALVAVTVNEYDVPSVRPGTIAEVAEPGTVTGEPSGAGVTVYDVIGDPPSDDGDQVTSAECSPGDASGTDGAVGAVGGGLAGVPKRASRSPFDPLPTAMQNKDVAQDTVENASKLVLWLGPTAATQLLPSQVSMSVCRLEP
jgi:hypothetical protein